jgi:hypothetical protein
MSIYWLPFAIVEAISFPRLAYGSTIFLLGTFNPFQHTNFFTSEVRLGFIKWCIHIYLSFSLMVHGSKDRCTIRKSTACIRRKPAGDIHKSILP